MLEHLSNSQVCQERAAEARAKAEVTENSVLKAEFLDIERRWLDLAESFAASDDLGHFTPTRSALRGSVPALMPGRTTPGDYKKLVLCSFKRVTLLPSTIACSIPLWA